MSEKREPFWTWPGWPLLRFTLVVGLATALWFALVYAGADWITAQRAYRVRLHLEAELSLPFVPAAALGYLSIYPLFWLAPFFLRSRRQIAALCWTLAVVILAGGVGFLLFPADMYYPPPPELGIWAWPVGFAKVVALHYNFLPSLHVALSAVCALAYAQGAGRIGKMLFGLWSAVIALSTLLLHQHYVIDVVTGYTLAGAGVWWVYQPRARAAGLVLSASPAHHGSCEPAGRARQSQ